MFSAQGENAFYGYLNMLTGGSFSAATIFALGIAPYINASIIVQLLTMAIPALERMVKEGGEEGKKKQAKITRYSTVVLGLVQGFIYYLNLARTTLTDGSVIIINNSVPVAIAIMLTFAAGTSLIMWLGELINNRGIGNGISMILFAGIISRFPDLVINGISFGEKGALETILVFVMIVVALVITGFVVWVSNAEHRVPVQYAKRVVGNKVYGGQSSHLP
jgi:preprotein translocase subunit SecY